MARLLVVALLLPAFAVAHDGMPRNPVLGVGGFPDCVQTRPVHELAGRSIEENEMTLECFQKPRDSDDQIQVGTIGDSITAGVHSSGGNHTYPGQLQILLDGAYPGKYKVTNLGACGSTMMKGANSPFWKRPQFSTLTSNKWDIIIIMLGTNDAKDSSSGGPANWPHDCTGPNALQCAFAQDYASMIKLVRTLGKGGKAPDIHLAVPPPLMASRAYGMNDTVINDVFPKLVRSINAANKIPHDVIDVYAALGGTADWRSTFPQGGCTVDNGTVAQCGFFCDAQSCDQCHPDDVGYHAMAQTMATGLGLGSLSTCKTTEYCCPDAKHCLTPTKTSCLHDEDACASGDVCCPLTKICVTPGAACASSCADQGTYCCPDAKACLTPTNPGVFCDGDNAKCGAGQVCCPLTKLCVKPGDTCIAP